MAEFDLIIKNGLVIDGKGDKPLRVDVAVIDGVVSGVGNFHRIECASMIDATGQIVAPGFIDTHTHDESFLLGKGDPLAKLSQGITFECVGSCGKSIHPTNPKTVALLQNYLGPALGGAEREFDWSSWGEFVSAHPQHNQPLKMASFVGHGSLRIAVLGFENRKPNSEELHKMCYLLEKELSEGCVGLSLGLSYPPGVFAETSELVTLAQVATRLNKPVVSHMRSESNSMIEAVQEMIEVARKSGCRMIISHHKAAGKNNYHKVHDSLALIEQARDEGLDIGVDVYPYTAGNTSITALLPPWTLSGGIPALLNALRDIHLRSRIETEINQERSWENLIDAAGWEGISISSCTHLSELEGKSLDQIALSMNKDPFEALFEIISITQGQCRVLVDDIDEEDVCFVLSHPLSQVISDSTDVIGKPHPRLYGTFPRVLGRYVRDKHVLGLVEAIKKMTSLPAARYNLKNRGVLEPGAAADIVIFDPEKITDTATYTNPRSYPRGISAVISSGKLVLLNGIPQDDIIVTPVQV